MSAYATRSSTDYSPSFDFLNGASVRMKAQTIATAAAMKDIAALTVLEQYYSDQVPQAASRLRYLVDRATVNFADAISDFGYR